MYELPIHTCHKDCSNFKFRPFIFYFNVLHLGPSHCITLDHLFPSSVMRVYRIALHVSVLRPSSEAEQVLQDLLLHSAHVQRVFTRLSSG
jgi:hypothetical protein